MAAKLLKVVLFNAYLPLFSLNLIERCTLLSNNYANFAYMKHFRITTIAIISALCGLFIADVAFMVSLYHSIKERYVDDVEQCLRRADFIELIDRLDSAGYGNEDGVIELWLGMQKSDIGAAKTPEELLRMDYSQGYKRMDRQLISVVTKHLHDTYGNVGEPDRQLLEEAFRRELNFSGFFPQEVVILKGDDTFEYSADLWEIGDRVDGKLITRAFISPLARNVLYEMSGIIVVNAAIAIVLGFAFWYLLHIISRQKTIEELKDDFTNNMTHELKTPIAIAYAANDSLLQFPDPADEVRTRKYLTAALEQLTKLTGLVENILAMSMERRRNLTMAKEKICLKTFLESIIEQQKIKIRKNCSISLVCDDSATVAADPTHLSNIISNLIDNSVKYSGDEVDIKIIADDRSIAVADNGLGIARKYLPEIFNKFYRVPSGNRQNQRGYGIGLFYVKSIVEKHGWSISVASEVGKGTTFTIKFAPQ